MSAAHRITWGAALAALFALGAAAPTGASHSVLERLSLSPSSAGNSPDPAAFASASTDGSLAFFDTRQSLDPADTDTAIDLYAREGSATTLVSTGPDGGNDSLYDALYAGNSEDGLRVFIHTREALVAADTDANRYDVYRRLGTTTTLISTGPATTNAGVDAFLRGLSADGKRVFFETTEKLLASDTDATTDVYAREGTTTTWISTATGAGNAAQHARFRAASADGATVFFDTAEKMLGADTDAVFDIYERTGSTTTQASSGTTGGNGAFTATFDAATADGSRVFFHTAESLVSGDSDGYFDVYEHSGGATTKLSNGNASAHADFAGASQDGSVLVYQTPESLDAADTDTALDAYQRVGATTTLLSDGPSGTDPNTDATPVAMSDDGTRVFFDTTEAITPATDTDAKFDLYERLGATTTHLSTGPAGGNGPHDAFLDSISSDGKRVFFETNESLIGTDTDSTFDVYERQASVLTHISKGSTGGNGNFIASFAGISQDGLSVFLHSNEQLEAGDTDAAQDVYKVTLAGYPRPGGATPLRASLVPAYVACTSPNRLHGPPDLPGGTSPDGSCSSPAQVSTSLTVGTPDAGGGGANSIGYVRLRVFPGVPGAPEDSNVGVTVSMSDVRCQGGVSPCGPANSAGGADYTGEVELVLSVRITDRWNAPTPGGGDDPATGQDTIRATLGCSMSAGTATGSTCSATTDVNAITLGTAARDGKRAIWQLDRILMNDGGPDGVVSTASGNKLFATQGIFVP